MTSVRPATQSDLQPWANMRSKLWPSATEQEHLLELKESFDQNTFQGWIALDADKYVGFAEASVRPFANGCDSRPVVFFEGVWVADEFRKSGIGRKFVAAVEDWARSKGINEVGSDAELSNTLSHTCHKKWGFEETERVVYYRKKLF
ncbi:MAG: GNAT family N-acetyltransferase [Bdellovibrionales bacterium]|nr:GNAT family N-acetyltransferase [Bdellovibrionales bacterium]